jgi:hypothetical protein
MQDTYLNVRTSRAPAVEDELFTSLDWDHPWGSG